MKPVYSLYVKRALDLFLASLLLLAATPLLIVTWALVRVKLGRPALFRQPRPGLQGVSFVLLKFRTMTDERDAVGDLLPEAQRLTRVGSFLRRTSLDEFPELLNVIRGEMSLVGPRPLLVEYLGRYTPEQFRRHSVRPGITGWAQVNGRNAISWAEKFKLDVWYVDNRSLGLDLQILIMTLRQVICQKGISAAGSATMPAFRGDSPARE
jgi:lipopolysaccharide/colanic/teichoic acid biosynthesis glycosyltransferase